jgi:protein-L-isoaspartate O-methyltransferase
VLEIGTGSGYATAVLSRIAKDTYTAERIGQLAEKAAVVLSTRGYQNVYLLHADEDKSTSCRGSFQKVRRREELYKPH